MSINELFNRLMTVPVDATQLDDYLKDQKKKTKKKKAKKKKTTTVKKKALSRNRISVKKANSERPELWDELLSLDQLRK